VTWTKLGTEQSLFPFSGRPGLNIDLEFRNKPLEYFELFITPELANLEQRNKSACPTISRKYAKLKKTSTG
jgi:hypothetical protein